MSISQPVSKHQEFLKTSSWVITNPELPASLSTFLTALRPQGRRKRRHTFSKLIAYVCNIFSITLSKKIFVTLSKAKPYAFLVLSFILLKRKRKMFGSQDWTLESATGLYSTA